MNLEVVYSQEPFPERVRRSIFLAGPTPRSADIPSWRPAALAALTARGYDGTVFVPEPRMEAAFPPYDAQVSWELAGLGRADAILFWIPRDLETLPGFTTNVELGYWARSGKVVLGAPGTAPKMRYLEVIAERHGIPRAATLEDAVARALDIVGGGAPRSGGECQVPLHIWRSAAFQRWYSAQRGAGNVLLGAELEWIFRTGPNGSFLYCFALHADIHVAAEGRRKKNEVVLARPDVAAVVLYRRDPHDLGRSEIVLVREFRSSASTCDGYVRECPSGSSFEPGHSLLDVAADEVREETGLALPAERLRPLASRQLMATMSAHKAHVFTAEISVAEMDRLRALAGTPQGAGGGEQTYVEIWTLDELRRDERADWSTLGMVLCALDHAPP